jgi:glucose/arabinose dehydrogenase
MFDLSTFDKFWLDSTMHWLLFLISIVLSNTSWAGYKISGTCDGFPRINIGTPVGWCASLIADRSNGLKLPRRIIELSDNRFLITDLGGWIPNRGKLFELSITNNEASIRTLITKLDRPHGLFKTKQGRVFLGEASEISEVLLTQKPSLDRLIENLPASGLHPLKEFVITSRNELLVNVGSASDSCVLEKDKTPIFPCEETIESIPRGSIQAYDLSSEIPSTTQKTFATGLRNSMAIMLLEEGDTWNLFQAENSTDYPDAELPAEELNHVTKDGFYGWPYCVTDEHGRVIRSRAYPDHKFCDRSKRPLQHWPAHAAPLHMIPPSEYATNTPWEGMALVAWKGYRPTGHKIMGLPVHRLQVTSSPLTIVSDWDEKKGIRPKGSPTGLLIDSQGNLWIVEDRNGTVIRISRE